MQRPDPGDKPRGPEQTPLTSGVIGALILFAIALLWIVFGIWKLLFIVVMTVTGYFIGYRYFRDRDTIRKLIDKILPPGMFR